MGEFTTLMARDGHEFSAHLSAPQGRARGAIVVIQEIFGVNAHIRSVADRFAAEGYLTIAPALFDRVRRGIELGYTEKEMQQGVGYALQIKPEKYLADVAASIAVVKHAGRVGIVGYCWGGTVAFVAASKLPVSCAIAYYGGGIARNLERKAAVPVMYHFGERDDHIPLDDIEKIRAADPEGIFHLYPAGHGFNCTERSDYDPASSKLAFERTLAFLGEHVG